MKRLLICILAAMTLSSHTMAQDGPTMGWSSWNTFGVNINENLILSQANAMVTTGLKDVGFDHINIDDGYFGGRDGTTGKLLIHPTRFPNGLRGIVDNIHSKGLKAGIYSDAGRNTCGSMFNGDAIGKGVGMLGHDQQDADLFFKELNFDFIKVDFCGGSWYHNEDHLVLDEQERYTAIAQAIRNTGRTDVRMNACRWAYPGTWVEGQAFSWRTTGDIYDGWESVKGILAENFYLSAYSSKGHYNDMDMLEVGRSMTDEEDKTHFGLWCIMNSPLLIGCNLTNIKSSTLALLKNQELIALNQDPLYQQAYVAGYVNGCHILVKDIEVKNGTKRAFAVYNPNDDTRQVTVSFNSLDLSGKVRLRDVFAKSNIGEFTNEYVVSLPAHGTRIYVAEADNRLERTLYEAETAYISVYQEIKDNQAEKTGVYSADASCSGGYKAGWLGSSEANALEWRNVYSKTGGEYEMTIGFICGENRNITVSVNGQAVQTVSVNSGGWGTVGTTTVTIQLAKGNNTVKLSNASGWMPDIDYMRVALTQPLGYGKGQNPVIFDRYTPDPAPYVHGDTLYLFVDHDEDETENGYFTMKDWLLYSTVDMVNWTYRGTPLTSATFSAWAKQDNDCWASQCIERNGKWYWYVTATIKGQAYPGIGVAVADSPYGPFHDPIGQPLVQGWFKIDPTVFIDDNGQAYLFYGNNNLWYTRLNEDMISTAGGEIEVNTKDVNAFGPFKGYNDDGTPKTNFEEASWIYKRNGKYYLEYAAGGVPEYWAYSTADNVAGPWTYQGKIMNQADNSFTIHGGSVEYRGHHYMFYHNGKLPGGGGFKRATCIEEFKRNADGSIPFIPFTSSGVEALQTVNPYVRQEAETINKCEGVLCEGNHNGCYVTRISSGDFIKVHGVDFGDEGATSFKARVRGTQGGTLIIRTGSQTGDIIGQLNVESTGGNWRELTCNLSSSVTGTTDLYFTFQGTGDSLFDFDYWSFAKESATVTTYQNPVIFADFPDPDVIRVGDTYYMISTTMHHFPGATIVKSTDLVHWEYCSQPLTQLANTDRYNLLNGQNAYAAGMWACSMKYHNGKFYILINGNDAGGWLLTATDPEGVWEKRKLGRGYYDPGMLFDNGKVYVACGIGNIQMCELDEDFNYIREVNVISDKSGLEGCHLYKVGNYYYIYATYGGWPSGQVVFRSQNIFGPYEERMLVEKYINNAPNTIHQGALFDTPTGEWWTIMQQDLGCLGRMPNMQPVTWVNDWPVVGNNGIPYTTYNCPTTSHPSSAKLPTNDNFSSSTIGMQWEWNHNPDDNAWSLTERPGWLRLKTSGVADRLTQARNMLTQRIFAFHNEPNKPSEGTVRIDVSNLQEGDRAGICIFQDPYAFLAVEKKNGQLQLLWRQDQLSTNNNFTPAEEVLAINNNVVYLKAAVTYGNSKTQFSYSFDNQTFTNIGGQTSLGFNLSVFVGARFGLFCYSTETSHTGYADFDWFETNNYVEGLDSYELGDDIVNYAPKVWEGQSNTYGGLGHEAYERYQSGSIGKGDVLTQTLTGVKSGTYDVTLELAGSFTPDRGFECPTGTGYSLAFANDQNRDLEVVRRDWVSSVQPITISCTVGEDKTLKYGIYNIADGGNWYVANVTSIKYVSANTDNTFNINTTAQHGTLSTDVSYAAAGTTVTLSATPDDLYQFDSYTVTTCTGEDVTVNGNTFVMPAADVTATANFSLNYNVGDDIVVMAPTDWEGQTGTYAGLGYTVSERYKHGGDNGAGDVLTQTLTGLKNGVYAVTLELAASFTSGRGFDCPTGDGLSVAFANGSQTNLEVVDRQGVGSVTPITLYATVTDGTLKYGIQNLKVSGNWYIANVTGIKYISESTTLTHQLSVTSAGVATLYLPFDAAIPEADFFIAAAVKSVSGTTAHLKEVRGVIPAQTGVMIFANAGNYTLSLAPTSSTESVESLLHGVLEETPVTTLAEQEGKTIYVLSRGVQEYTGFKPVYGTGSVKTIPAYKAYLPLEVSGEVNFINLSFGDDATAIEKILKPTDDGQWTMDDGQWYTLDGRRLNAKPTQRGLYIVNGKKVLYKP